MKPAFSSSAESGVANGVRAAKAQLREAVRGAIDGLTAEERLRRSSMVCRRLSENQLWCRAVSVLAYAPRPDEIDIRPLITSGLSEGKRISLPRYDPAGDRYQACRIGLPVCELPLGKFGIPEPGEDCPDVPLNQLDLVLVPGIVFDLAGHRLGRGRGFYDRLLTGVRAPKCGLGFDEQVRPEIPVETHDVLLDCVMTPTRWLVFRPPRPGDDLVG
jgi:5-formyltetrahydrofolate cyclo-ligase